MKYIIILSIFTFLFNYNGLAQSKKTRAKNEARMLEGLKFLNENGKKEGVVTLFSGLQYEVLEKGEGKSPKLNSQVTTHYHGTFINGEVFDSSVDRGSPATFLVNGVIKGWTEALQLMKVGSKWRLYVPYHIAYGESGSGTIKPFSMLIFEVELLEIR